MGFRGKQLNGEERCVEKPSEVVKVAAAGRSLKMTLGAALVQSAMGSEREIVSIKNEKDQVQGAIAVGVHWILSQVTSEGIADERVTDEGIEDERVTDEGIDDERVKNEGIDDERVTNTRIDDERVTNTRIEDKRVADAMTQKDPAQKPQHYHLLKVGELREECARRGIDVSGYKDQLISRLYKAAYEGLS
eukprot:4713945-Amphidinium_carterae.1